MHLTGIYLKRLLVILIAELLCPIIINGDQDVEQIISV